MDRKINISHYLIILFGALLSFYSCDQTNEELPTVWTSYRLVDSYDKDFEDLKAHGVGAVNIRKASPEVLAAARKHDMKLIISIEEISERAYEIPQDRVERAVMVGGAYNGKAIDRNRFAFSQGKHSILIEQPVYDSVDCYDKLGHYFPGIYPPIRAEIVVKQKDFDGKQHLKIVKAEIGDQVDEYHWDIHFDLTDVEGDLNNIAIAVYWISEGTRDYWMFGDAASPGAASTTDQLRENINVLIEEWKDANGGEFPKDLIFALRFGDECFHVSGHMNCAACSYPMWDYSATTIKIYYQTTDLRYPTGKLWLDMYGRESYAKWMYNYHTLTAGLVDMVKETLENQDLDELLVLRNITRFNVFNELNDHDGSGLDLLAQSLDVVHLDPYPVNAKGYRESVIPVGMAYCEGLARRHSKLLVPWLQAHQYWPGRGGLAHPTPDLIKKMVKQHLDYSSDAIMWLGYGKPPFNTFPLENPDSWETAKYQHEQFSGQKKSYVQPDFAAIRPYNVRALRNRDNFGLDQFFTDEILTAAVIELDLHFDPFEPISISKISPDDIAPYDFILAEAGELDKEELSVITQGSGRAVVFIYNADSWTNDPSITGIIEIEKIPQKELMVDQHEGTVLLNMKYNLQKDAEIIYSAKGLPVVWKFNNILFVGGISKNVDFISALTKLVFA